MKRDTSPTGNRETRNAVSMRPRIRNLLLNAVISLAGLALLAGLVWFLGPLLPVLESTVFRLVLCAALFLAWGGAAFFIVYRLRRREAELEAGLLGSLSDAAEEAETLRARFAAALKTLSHANLLHSQPWYVIIGPPGAGKTTALLNAGLSFPFADGDSGSASLDGVGGTRDCDWWFTDRAVLIDTAGRYTTQDSDEGRDRAGWDAFLNLLRRTRPRQPLNGIIVAIPAVEIAGAPIALRSAHAIAIRQRVEELRTRLKAELPIYLLFTKADLIAGFTEFFDDLDAEKRTQIWGTTFALGRGRPWPDPDTEDSLAALVQRLGERVIDRLEAERSPDRRRLIAGFPAQVATIAGPLAAFVTETFGGSKLRPAPLLRGVYFASGTQAGTPVDRLTELLTRAFGLTAEQLPSLRPQAGRSYFLHRLLAGVLPGEAMLVARQPAAIRRRLVLRGGGFALVGLAVAGGLAAVWQARESGLAARAQIRTSLTMQANAAASRRLDPVSDNDLPGLLPLLNAARDTPFARVVASVPGPATPADELGEIGRTTYRQALEHSFLPRLVRRLEGEMTAGLNRPEFIYDATRVYLMLGGAGPLDPAMVRDWMRNGWRQAYPGPANAAVRDALAQHLDALLVLPLPPIELDGGLVERARAVFARISPASRVYATIRQTSELPAWSPRVAMGPIGAVLFTRRSGRSLDDGVPGLLTAAGFYEAFLPRLASAIRAVASESWVTGSSTGSAENTARLAALETEVDALYQSEFLRTWDNLLDDIDVVPLASVSQAAQDVFVMTSVQSPVRSLLSAVVAQVTLPVPRSAAVVLATGRAPPQPPLAAAIAAHYTPLQSLVGTGPGAPLDQALRSLTEVRQLLAKVAGAAINVPVAAPGASDPIAALKVEAGRWPVPLRRWFISIADSATALRDAAPK